MRVSACVHACVHACARACVRACVRSCAKEGEPPARLGRDADGPPRGCPNGRSGVVRVCCCWTCPAEGGCMVRIRRCTRHVARGMLHLTRRLLPFVCCIIEWVHAVCYMLSVVCCMLFFAPHAASSALRGARAAGLHAALVYLVCCMMHSAPLRHCAANADGVQEACCKPRAARGTA